jgi:hypothetical protein
MVDYRALTASRGTFVGMCPICETVMYRFVSRARLAAVAAAFNVQIRGLQDSLDDTGLPTLNCAFEDKD